MHDHTVFITLKGRKKVLNFRGKKYRKMKNKNGNIEPGKTREIF